MTAGQSLDGVLAAATRLGQRQADWAGEEGSSDLERSATVRWLGVLAGGWCEAASERLIDSYGAVGLELPDDLEDTLARMGASRQPD